MKLATKLTAALVLGIVLVMGGYAWLQIRQEGMLRDADLNRARRAGLAWLATVESVWQVEGERRARDLVAIAGRRSRQMTLGVVSLAPGAADGPRVPLSPAQREALLSGEVVRTMRREASGEEWLYAYGAVAGATPPTAIEVGEPLREERRFIQMGRAGILLATVAVVVVCSLIAMVLHASLVGRPLRRLRDKARRIGAGDFSGPFPLERRDEVGDLARELNRMCEQLAEARDRIAAETEARIQAIERLRHTDRLATLGQLAAGVAHELGTPLSVVSARAELLVSEPGAREVSALARVILEQSDRMADIIRQLLEFSRRRRTRIRIADLGQVVRRTLDLVTPAARRTGVTVACEAGEAHGLARVDQNQLEQALANVIMNGIQAMPGGGRLRVRVHTRRDRDPATGARETDRVCVTVEDEGIGIPREHLVRLFDPFFTTRGTGEGTGLGLAVAHGIVAEHGGWIEVASEVGVGSRFTIVLPRPDVAEGHLAEVAS